MIPANSMYLTQLKTKWRLTLAIVSGVTLISAIVVSSFVGWRMFPRQVLYQFIGSACVGCLFWLAGPLIRSYSDGMAPGPRWCFRILSWAILLNTGVLAGLAFLSIIGALPWKLYGQMFWTGFLPSTVIGVVCSVAFTMYETLKFKSQYERMQARLSSLESHLRPHFLFNTLNSITALIPEDPAAAEQMTINLSALLRYSLDSTHQSTVRLERELKVMTDYLEIEKVRFGSRLQYAIDVPQRLMRAEVPPFCLQTLVENSVKYGGNEIRISARNGGSNLILSVWDSGPGFGGTERDLAPGHGLDNLRSRLTALWGSNAALEFPHTRAGSTVQISLPFKSSE